MSKKDKTKKSGNVGSFFFGTFIGFILCLGALVGVGCFAYFKVSPAWINKTFKTNIDLGNDNINNKTLSDFVGSAMSLAKNVDTYSLADLKNDFGINVADEFMGLDITDLKTVGLKDLPDAVKNKFANISADELKNVMNLSDMSKILDKCNIYYFNSADDKLYKSFDGITYSNEVDFDYELSEDKSKVITKKHESQIVMNDEHLVINQVNIQLRYLPLTSALGDFTANMGNQITLKDLETDYGVELPSFFDGVDKENTTINELEDAINDLYLADFLGYTLDKTNPNNITVKDKLGNKVTGIMAIVAKEQVKNLSNLKTKIDDVEISEILNLNIKLYTFTDTTTNETISYYYDDKDNDGVVDSGEKVATVMKIIAETKVKELSGVINGLTVGQIFTEKELSSGALSLIPSTTLVNDIATTLNERFKTLTLGELVDNKVIVLDTAAQVTYNNKKDLYVTGTSTRVKDLLLKDLVTLALNSIPTTSTPVS